MGFCRIGLLEGGDLWLRFGVQKAGRDHDDLQAY